MAGCSGGGADSENLRGTTSINLHTALSSFCRSSYDMTGTSEISFKGESSSYGMTELLDAWQYI